MISKKCICYYYSIQTLLSSSTCSISFPNFHLIDQPIRNSVTLVLKCPNRNRIIKVTLLQFTVFDSAYINQITTYQVMLHDAWIGYINNVGFLNRHAAAIPMTAMNIPNARQHLIFLVRGQ